MTRDEAIKIQMIIQAAYPNYKSPDKSITVNLWASMFKNEPYEVVEKAIYDYINQCNAFAPSIGQIKQIIYADSNALSEGEAWALVLKAMQRSGYYAEEEFAKLPEAIQKAVGSPSALKEIAIDENANISVENSIFCRKYRQVLERDRYDAIAAGTDNRLESKEVEAIEGGC